MKYNCKIAQIFCPGKLLVGDFISRFFQGNAREAPAASKRRRDFPHARQAFEERLVPLGCDEVIVRLQAQKHVRRDARRPLA